MIVSRVDRFKEWQLKYPSLKSQTPLTIQTIKDMNLPLRYNDKREDGFIFKWYYCRNSGNGPAIFESWASPKAEKKRKINRLTYSKKVYDRNKNFINRYKRLKGCTICGWKESIWGLHFDHIDPKKKKSSVSEMTGHSIESLKKEIRKCNLLCANCHSIRTEKQFSTPKKGA
jgi:hypothetical protein|tara:strand:- start:1097 stop:1612 length:516 start_codon:yes stop_codon:yes gene_type:complete